MLDLESLYVCDLQNSSDTYSLTIDNYEFIVPNLGFNLKITNFYKSNIPVYADNIHTKLKQDNQYYDIHYFFNTLAFAGFFPKFMSSEYIHKDVKEFVKRVIPDKYRSKICIHKSPSTKKEEKKDVQCSICNKYVHSKGRLLVDDEYITPAKILSDPFFEEFHKVY